MSEIKKIDLSEIEKSMENNRKSRLWFVDFWANYVRTHSDKEWSRQQNILINSVIQNARQFKMSREQYLKIKGERMR